MDKRFSGVWFIEKMEVWGLNCLNLLGPANITFDDDGLGSFQFVAVVGFIDCQFSKRDGLPLVEFSWQGQDDNEEACGKGWGIIEGNGKLHGRIFIHCADDSAFTANRVGYPGINVSHHDLVKQAADHIEIRAAH